MYGGNVTFALGICRNCRARVLLDKSVEMVSKEDSHDEYYETDIDNTRECLVQVSYVKKLCTFYSFHLHHTQIWLSLVKRNGSRARDFG